MSAPSPRPSVYIIGAGPAGLIAAETLAEKGLDVAVFEKKPVPARKFLMAGRGGLNLTHSEDLEIFLTRYGAGRPMVEDAIRAFPPAALRAWAAALGEETFVGSSGRVFPRSFKASPLLRAWQARLTAQGVRTHYAHDWQGWQADGGILFESAGSAVSFPPPAAMLLALGGASWPKLGADGAWVDCLHARGVSLSPFQPANCGFHVAWSDYFAQKHAGQPLKPLALSLQGRRVDSEAMITAAGIEGGGIYALSSPIREMVAAQGSATLMLDLRPGLSEAELAQRLGKPRGAKSLGTWLRTAGGLSSLAATLLREPAAHGQDLDSLNAGALARRIKALPLKLDQPFSLARAISSAGGIEAASLDGFRLRALPAVYAAGEMLDWEAPTGGYLLQACFATGIAAARQILRDLGV